MEVFAMMKNKALFCIILAAAMLLSGCGGRPASQKADYAYAVTEEAPAAVQTVTP